MGSSLAGYTKQIGLVERGCRKLKNRAGNVRFLPDYLILNLKKPTFGRLINI